MNYYQKLIHIVNYVSLTNALPLGELTKLCHRFKVRTSRVLAGPCTGSKLCKSFQERNIFLWFEWGVEFNAMLSESSHAVYWVKFVLG